MMRRDIGRDPQLQVRMIVTIFLLGGLYAGFILALLALGAGVVLILVFAVVLVAVQLAFSGKMVLLSMRAKIVSPEEEPKLHAMVERLAQTAGLPKPKVAVSKLPMPNAFATGRNTKGAIVAVTTGLQELLSDDEMEGVLAHEMSHIKHRDMMVMTYASFFAVVASTLMTLFFWMGLFSMMSGGRGRNSGGSVIMIAYLLTFVVLILSQILLATLSRYREFSADRGAAILTRKPANLASALTRIHGTINRIPKGDLRKAEGMNAFFILPAMGSMAGLFSTHPTVAKRIEALRAIEADMGE